MNLSKRRLSSPEFPTAKRLHDLSGTKASSTLPLNFGTALYDELVLLIFSHLDWLQLCRITMTCKHFSRLASDNELWRRLYLNVFGRTRLRGSRGFIARTDGRELRPLPNRAKGPNAEDDWKDWRWMFRIAKNWQTGRCAMEPLPFPLPQAMDTDHVHVLLAGSLTVMASANALPSVQIHLHNASTGDSHTVVCASTRSALCHITAIALDQSQPVSGLLQLAVFISTGEFMILSINPANPSLSAQKLTYVPARKDSRNSPILQAAYHHPLLVTLSEAFSLSIYDLSESKVSHTQTLSSFTSYPPSSLVLSTPSATSYKLILAYAIPVYPKHWSAGVTELIIQGHGFIPSLSISGAPASPMSVVSTRTTRSLDIPHGFIDEQKLSSMREQWSRKVARVADIETDGRYVVLGPADLRSQESPSLSQSSSFHTCTNLQLYRLSLPAAASIASSPPRLTFVRTLSGQMGPVAALALADGRCISVGRNGSIWVWDLEGGPGAEVSGPKYTSSDPSSASSCAVAFDERRIVTTGSGQVVVRRFDI